MTTGHRQIDALGRRKLATNGAAILSSASASCCCGGSECENRWMFTSCCSGHVLFYTTTDLSEYESLVVHYGPLDLCGTITKVCAKACQYCTQTPFQMVVTVEDVALDCWDTCLPIGGGQWIKPQNPAALAAQINSAYVVPLKPLDASSCIWEKTFVGDGPGVVGFDVYSDDTCTTLTGTTSHACKLTITKTNATTFAVAITVGPFTIFEATATVDSMDCLSPFSVENDITSCDPAGDATVGQGGTMNVSADYVIAEPEEDLTVVDDCDVATCRECCVRCQAGYDDGTPSGVHKFCYSKDSIVRMELRLNSNARGGPTFEDTTKLFTQVFYGMVGRRAWEHVHSPGQTDTLQWDCQADGYPLPDVQIRDPECLGNVYTSSGFPWTHTTQLGCKVTRQWRVTLAGGASTGIVFFDCDGTGRVVAGPVTDYLVAELKVWIMGNTCCRDEGEVEAGDIDCNEGTDDCTTDGNCDEGEAP